MPNLLKSLSFSAALLLIAITSPTPSHAQDAQKAKTPILSTLEAMVVKRSDDGKETFRKAKRVNPGELIEYRIAHKNRSGDALKGFIVQGPIPTGTTFIGGSESTANKAVFEVLVPGEKWQKEPAYKTKVSKDGKKERVAAAPSEYKSIRWVLSGALKNDTDATGKYRVKVNTN